jgi:NADH-quinone oxidoreductase subunit D
MFIFVTPNIFLFSLRAISRSFCLYLNPVNAGLSYRRLKNVTLSFGPNHPAAHGILKMILQLSGEVIQRADPQFGFLHRGSEKLSEDREYLKALPYFDRMDYVANLFQEHAFCLAVEDLLLERGNKMYTHCLTHVRILFDELSRVLNHLLTLSATCLDIGSMGPIF